MDGICSGGFFLQYLLLKVESWAEKNSYVIVPWQILKIIWETGYEKSHVIDILFKGYVLRGSNITLGPFSTANGIFFGICHMSIMKTCPIPSWTYSQILATLAQVACSGCSEQGSLHRCQQKWMKQLGPYSQSSTFLSNVWQDNCIIIHI